MSWNTGILGNRDLTQVLSEVKTYIILGFGSLVLSFIYFLGGWNGFYAVFSWADEFDDALLLVFGPAVLFLTGLVLLVLGFHEYGEYSLIRNTPTATVRSAPMGRVEVKGISEPLNSEQLLQSPFAREPCLAYECEVEEYESDDDGGHWTTVYTNRETRPFFLRDDTGKLVVEAQNAEWFLGDYDYRNKFLENQAPEHIRTFVEREIDSDRLLDFDLVTGDRLRFSENYISPERELYVLGAARPLDSYFDGDDDVGEADLLVGQDPNTGAFYLSNRSEQEIIDEKWWGILGLILGGSLLTPSAAVALCYVLGVL